MRFLFLCRGLGEYAQAESFAQFAASKGVNCFFLIANVEDVNIYKRAISKSGFDFKITKTPDETDCLIYSFNPQAVFLCNSKTSREFIKKRPKIKELLVGSLDSNWTFNNCGPLFKVFSWIDNFFVVMPQKIFKLGLWENSGHYKINRAILNKIYCPGFIPSGANFNAHQIREIRKKIKLKRGEKLIYLYLGRGGSFRWRWFLLPILVCVFDELYKTYKNFRVLFVGEHKIKRRWAISVNWIDDIEYLEKVIAASDLVIQHHGLGTLPRAIHAGIPVICLTPKIFPNMPYYITSYYYEIEPFAKLGLCINMQFTDYFTNYIKNIENLLFNSEIRNQMIKKQKEIFSPGEENLYKFILKKLSKK